MKKLTSKQAAYYLNISESTLRAWRCKKTHNILYRQYGKHGRVLYDIEELDKFIKRCETK